MLLEHTEHGGKLASVTDFKVYGFLIQLCTLLTRLRVFICRRKGCDNGHIFLSFFSPHIFLLLTGLLLVTNYLDKIADQQ